MAITDTQKRLLVAILRATEQLAASRVPPPGTFAAADHRFALNHGPRYQPGEWFPELAHPSLQKRLLRSLVAMHRAGLVVAIKKYGQRLTHVKLSESGRALAESLRQEQTPTETNS